MMWDVSDTGKVVVKLHAEGEAARQMSQQQADAYIANIVGDLTASQGIEVVTDELRYSISKVRAEITVTWRARVDQDRVTDVREYLARLARSLDPVVGEVVDEPPD